MPGDFGISDSCLQRWLKIADREDGLAPPASSSREGVGNPDESAELRELRRRNQLRESTALSSQDGVEPVDQPASDKADEFGDDLAFVAQAVAAVLPAE
ncbi:hypothetical protein [Modestobacter sp. URMC 112]